MFSKEKKKGLVDTMPMSEGARKMAAMYDKCTDKKFSVHSALFTGMIIILAVAVFMIGYMCGINTICGTKIVF